MSNSKTVYDQWEMLQREQRRQHQRFSPSARCRECEIGLDLTHTKCGRCFRVRPPSTAPFLCGECRYFLTTLKRDRKPKENNRV